MGEDQKMFKVGNVSYPIQANKTPFVPQAPNFVRKSIDENTLENIMASVSINKPILLIGPTGCIAGDTIVNINRAKNGRSRTLKQLYNLLNGNLDRLSNIRTGAFNPKIPTFIRSFDGVRITLKKLKNVIYKGKQENEVYLYKK